MGQYLTCVESTLQKKKKKKKIPADWEGINEEIVRETEDKLHRGEEHGEALPTVASALDTRCECCICDCKINNNKIYL